MDVKTTMRPSNWSSPGALVVFFILILAAFTIIEKEIVVYFLWVLPAQKGERERKKRIKRLK